MAGRYGMMMWTMGMMCMSTPFCARFPEVMR